jgi:hypothetical protein
VSPETHFISRVYCTTLHEYFLQDSYALWAQVKKLRKHIGILSRLLDAWLLTGFGLDIEFIDHLYTPRGTTNNYSAIAILHVLQITTAHAKLFFQPAVSSTAVPH